MRLSDIKDADGKSLMIDNCKFPAFTGKDSDNIYARECQGFNQALEEQSQRQVAVEVDNEKLARYLMYSTECSDDLGKTTAEIWPKYLRQADHIIAHKEELFKIIYVKD